jgi:putative hydrolase of the HAD superfamily
MLKAVMFDFGHTIMDEVKERTEPLARRSVHLMPGLPGILRQIPLKMGIWANADCRGQEVWLWLKRARIDDYFTWVATSADAGARKPSHRFFSYALKQCELGKDEIVFVGNQLNTDIRGAKEYGIKCVFLSGAAYRSPDDDPAAQIQPNYTIGSLKELLALLKALREDRIP